MPKQISSISELVKDIQRRVDSGDKSIMKELKNSKGQTLEQVTKEDLGRAGAALKQFLRDWIQAYFDSRQPKWYERTGAFIDSVKVKVFSERGISKAVVYFEDSGSIRNSFLDKGKKKRTQRRGYLPALLNDGWIVKKDVWFRDVEFLGYYKRQDSHEGFGFMELAFAQAKRDPRFKNIEIEMEKNVPWDLL